MLVRKLGVVAISAGLLFGTAGCSFSSNVASKAVYAPSDGNQTDSGSLHARNVLALSDGTHAILIGSITNDGDIPQTTTIKITSGAVAAPATFVVPAQGKIDFGYPAELGYDGTYKGIELLGTLPAVGSNIEIQLNDDAKATIAVQVLDGTVPTYASLMPFLVPTPVATPSATPEATPSATPSAN